MKDFFVFYKNKNVFITGSTGFKGSWLCEILTYAGADVTGFSLNRNASPKLYKLALERFGLKGEECLFLDDSEQNVVGARAVGINAECVDSLEGILAALGKHGISVKLNH